MTMPWWEYFGAHRAPFARQITVEHLFPAAPLVECRARIAAVVEEPGVFVLTGESGVGKSTALRAALQPLNPTHYDVCYLAVGEAWTPYTFFQALALALHVPHAAPSLPLEQAIRDVLWTSATQQGRRPVLVLDEAHWLTVPLFNTLRRLLNFAMDTTAPFALILAGHTELRQKLALRPLEAMRQRVTLAYHLRPLTREETAADLQHQLKQVGVEHPVFTEAAMAAGHDWAQGLPRRLNRWAQACLLAAYGAQQPLVDERILAVAQAELQWADPT
jgi:type II secretory pathway predicted ATPase ExeA